MCSQPVSEKPIEHELNMKSQLNTLQQGCMHSTHTHVLPFVSQKLKSENFPRGGKLDCSQGESPPCSPCPGEHEAVCAADCQHSAETSTAFSHLSGFLSPRGCRTLVKNWMFRLLTSRSDGFNRLAVIIHCFHVEHFKGRKAHGLSDVPG